MQLTSSGLERDLRVDFCRGVALIVVLINHIEWVTSNKLVSFFSSSPLGYSNMAQVFVLLSGYSYGMAHKKRMILGGYRQVIAKSFSRAFRIYSYHIIITMLLLVIFLEPFLNDERNPFIKHGMDAFIGNPFLYLVEILSLTRFPAYLDILPLYVVMLIWAPLLMIVYYKNKFLSIILSVSLYIYSQVYHLGVLYGLTNIYIPFSHHVFNPLAWQFLFFIGMMFGIKKASNNKIEFGWACKYSAFLFLGAAFLHFKIIKPLLRRGYIQLDTAWLTIPYDKTFLTIALVMHVLCLWLLFVLVSPKSESYEKFMLAKPFMLCGRNAIDVFALGTILIFSINYMYKELDGGVALMVAFEIIAVTLSFSLAYGLEVWRRELAGRGKRRPAQIN